jgi:hypothetical protein
MANSRQGGDLLDLAYRDLDLLGGSLLSSSSEPSAETAGVWEAVGDWLMLADRMGAERVFFVGDDPVVLFARLPPPVAEEQILATYRRAWSIARPSCLFLSTEEELRVYALSSLPARTLDQAEELQPLEIVTRAADVSEVLARYHRERLESGALFDEAPYHSRHGRADTQLLHDVRAANEALVTAGLPPGVAHSLIERVILIRYLEDRAIVTEEYFREIAQKDDAWVRALNADSPTTPQLGASSTFASCLGSKRFTYAVFDRLEHDFNGDLFVVGDDERRTVRREHLALVRRLLAGAGVGVQEPLFFWAYDFSVVPTSLISSMYEEFYRAGTDDDSGTHYTPPELVEFLLARVLTPEVLDRAPTICDPACGSGIFLVEAYRRLVRHEVASRGQRLGSGDLRGLLLTRLAGVDLNPEAIRLAAFSLYLAYLNYQDPRDIRAAGPLPRLIQQERTPRKASVLVSADAFSPMIDEEDDGESATAVLPWQAKRFDVVIGNPPWDEPRRSWPRTADDWASRNELPVGDRNPSQLFLWRSLSFLASNGVCALLVGATAIHNSRSTSRLFRSSWLRQVELEEVVNFTAARSLFFDGGIAPFMLVKFRHPPGSSADFARSFVYRAVRPSTALTSTRSLEHARLGRRWVDQQSLLRRDYLWKTYAWGSHHDDAFMARLDTEHRLFDFLPRDPKPGYGYQRGKGDPSELLRSLPSLKRFDPWGPFREEWFEDPPKGVKRQPDERLYGGQRIIVARGVRSGFGPSARLVDARFSFRHTIYCLPVESLPVWQARTMLGTLLSALGRYRLFMASGSWGVWHDSVVPEDVLGLPIRMAGARHEITRRISRAVKSLEGTVSLEGGLDLFADGSGDDQNPLRRVQTQLDEAVYDLFELTGAERDLVRDFHAYTLPLVGRPRSWAAQPTVNLTEPRHGTAADVANQVDGSLDRYLSAFLGRWNRELPPSGEFSWSVFAAPGSAMIAAVFETKEKNEPVSVLTEGGDRLWHAALDRLGDSLPQPLTSSMRTSGFLRSVSDRSVVIVKANEARLWTASAAREDAEATILQAMRLRAS